MLAVWNAIDYYKSKSVLYLPTPEVGGVIGYVCSWLCVCLWDSLRYERQKALAKTAKLVVKRLKFKFTWFSSVVDTGHVL